jgi:Zn ribbon nucleic-acid-binding protein
MSEEKCKSGCCSCRQRPEMEKARQWEFAEGVSCPKCGGNKVLVLSLNGLTRRNCVKCGWRDAVRTECA